MTEQQLALIKEQHATWSRAEIDCNSVRLRLEQDIADLRNRAEVQRRKIMDSALQRMNELGLEFKRLGESAGTAP